MIIHCEAITVKVCLYPLIWSGKPTLCRVPLTSIVTLTFHLHPNIFHIKYCHTFPFFARSAFVLTILDMKHHYERKTPNYSPWFAATQYIIYSSQNVTNSLKWIKDFSCNGTLFHNVQCYFVEVHEKLRSTWLRWFAKRDHYI